MEEESSETLSSRIYTRVMKTATCIFLLVVAFIVVEAAPRGESGGGPRKPFPEGVSWKLEDIVTTEHCCDCLRVPRCRIFPISCCPWTLDGSQG